VLNGQSPGKGFALDIPAGYESEESGVALPCSMGENARRQFLSLLKLQNNFAKSEVERVFARIKATEEIGRKISTVGILFLFLRNVLKP
jgi:hypothetical protein